jgi:hypothetical protein
MQEQLELFTEDFLASLSHSQEKVKPRTTIAIYGTNSQDSLRKFDLVGLSARMYQEFLTADSKQPLVTWKKKATKFGFSVLQLVISGQSTKDKGTLSLLATPTASQSYKRIRPLAPSEANGKHGKVLPGSIGENFESYIGKYPNPAFVEWMMGYPENWTKID